MMTQRYKKWFTAEEVLLELDKYDKKEFDSQLLKNIAEKIGIVNDSDDFDVGAGNDVDVGAVNDVDVGAGN